MISADHFHDNGDGTAWLIGDHDPNEEATAADDLPLDRPCDTCGWAERAAVNVICSSDCIDGRHTFLLSVACPVGHPSTPCEEWSGVINKVTGYGQAYNPETQRVMRAHRKVWAEANGPIPPGMVLMHLCDNPPCVRLDHLRLATRADNQADMRAKGRSANGQQLPHSKLTAEEVKEIRSMDVRYAVLAARFGVDASVIGKIKRNQIWVTPEPCGCTNGVIEVRCSIVPGMVLPIYNIYGVGPEVDRGVPHVMMDDTGAWYLDGDGGIWSITLPSAAKPGMWAVKLKVAK